MCEALEQLPRQQNVAVVCPRGAVITLDCILAARVLTYNARKRMQHYSIYS